MRKQYKNKRKRAIEMVRYYMHRPFGCRCTIHLELRAIATSYMQHNAENLSCYFNAHETMDEYLASSKNRHAQFICLHGLWKLKFWNVQYVAECFVNLDILTSGYTFCHIHVKTAMLCMRIPKKLFIWSIHVTTMNLLGECDIGLAHIY